MKLTSQKFIIPFIFLVCIVSSFFIWDKLKTPSLLVSVEEESEVLVSIENKISDTKFEKNPKQSLGVIIYSPLKEKELEDNNQRIIIDHDAKDIYFKTLDKEKNIVHGYSTRIVDDVIITHIYINPDFELNDQSLEAIINRNYIFSLLDAPHLLSENPDYTNLRTISNQIFNQLDENNLRLIRIKK